MSGITDLKTCSTCRAWCRTGWEAMVQEDASGTVLSGRQNNGSVGINYRYVRAYPEESARWLKAALESSAIPPYLQMLSDPGADLRAETAAVVNGTIAFCDETIAWAYGFPCAANNAASLSEFMSVLTYLDDEEDSRLNDAARRALGADHPWVRVCSTASGQDRQRAN